MDRNMESESVGQMKFGLDEVFRDSGYTYRIVCEDGKNFIVTRDYDTKRINLTIEKGMVVKATRG